MTEDEIYYAYLKENPELLAFNPFDSENRKVITSTFVYKCFDVKMNLIQLLEDAKIIKPQPRYSTRLESIALLRAALESFGHDTSHLSDEELEMNATIVADGFRAVGVSVEEAVDSIKQFKEMGYSLEEVSLNDDELNKIEQPWKTKRKKKPWE